MAHSFTKQASTYALGRAIYPASLFKFLASLTPSHSLAWDVGTGNGQAAIKLADHYAKVIATDASEQQIHHATLHPNITYAVIHHQMAEQHVKPLVADGSVDLVVCAQALHWFDLDTFYGQVRRVLRNPGGVIAAWSYGYPSVTPAVDAVLSSFNDRISHDWAPQIQYIKEGYKTMPFPFAPVVSSKLTTTGPFPIECAKEATLVEYMSHLRSWSAVQKAIDAGRDVWSEQQQKLFTDAWGDSPRRTVKWTLNTLIGTL